MMEYLRYLAWPAVVLILGLVAVLKDRKLSITLPTGTSVSLSPKEASEKLTRLFRTFQSQYDTLLRPEHRDFFQEVLRRGDDLPIVRDLLSEEFERTPKQIGTLRALRGLGLIRPEGGGKWRADSKILTTEFGEVFTEYTRETRS